METYDALARAIGETEAIVGRIEPAQLGRPTPCRDWDVRGVLNHLLGSMSLGTGLISSTEPDHPSPPGGQPDIDLIGDDPATAYKEQSERLLAAAAADGAFDGMCQTPVGEMPAAALGGILGLDVLVHGWDLAQATGQSVTPNTGLATHFLGFAEQAIGPDIRAGGLVGPVVTVDDEAPVMDRLVGHMGRTP